MSGILYFTQRRLFLIPQKITIFFHSSLPPACPLDVSLEHEKIYILVLTNFPASEWLRSTSFTLLNRFAFFPYSLLEAETERDRAIGFRRDDDVPVFSSEERVYTAGGKAVRAPGWREKPRKEGKKLRNMILLRQSAHYRDTE